MVYREAMPTLGGVESWFEATVTGPGTLSFWWRIESDGSDRLELWIDGVKVREIGGNTSWQQASWIVAGGSHTVRWRYVKDSSGSGSGDVALVDEGVSQPADSAPVVSNVRALQRRGEKLVDLYYDIAGLGQMNVSRMI